jgi:hypothetical protein
MKDEDIRKMAKARVEFRDHLFVYAIVNIILAVINLWSSPGFWWFPIVLFFWGIGLVFHYRDAYHDTESARIEKEYQKLKARQKK